jgi:hypothetical protein
MGRAKLSKEAKIIKGTFRPCREQEPTDWFPELDKMPEPPEELGDCKRIFRELEICRSGNYSFKASYVSRHWQFNISINEICYATQKSFQMVVEKLA